MSHDVEILEVEPASDLLRQVIELGNGPAKQRLGHLPDEGFSDRACKGTLLAAARDGQLLGYVLYDLPRRSITIRHLCVSRKARHTGVARRLIAAISTRHEHRQRIELRCRDDYGLAGMWQALGFRPQGSRPGRSKAGHMLTTWVLDLDDSAYPTLFDDFQGDRAIAALDHNVFLDLHMSINQRPQAKESKFLMEDWVGEQVDLVVTNEIFYEILNHPDALERSREQQWANQHRQISKANDDWEALRDEVADLAPDADDADHRHVARAIAAGADFLVSRDVALLDASEAIENAFGLAVLSPAGLIVRLDRERADDPYQPVALAGTSLQRLSPAEHTHKALISALLNNAAGERRSDLAARLRPILADRKTYEVQVIKNSDDRIIGGFARRDAGECLEIPFMRVVAQPGSNVVARQLLFDQRKQAADLRLPQATITDPHISKDIHDVLEREHFEETPDGWTAQIKVGLSDVTQVDLMQPRPMTASEYEDRYWPVKLMGGAVPSYLVPIRIPFAEDLGLAEETLLPRKLGLGLNREHVYYRKTLNDRGISPGARILWYVSGGTTAQRRGAIRAISQVAEVVIGRPRTLHARFERFGVYSLEQVLECADGNGDVMALRFVNTEILNHPINLDELKTIWAEQGGVFEAPQSPTLIGEHMFCLLYRRSSAYAS